MKLKRYTTFINESIKGSDSLTIDDYIMHEDDIKDIFSELYKDVPHLEKSEIYLYDCTHDEHPHIRKSIGLEKGVSQFKVTFFIKKEDTSDGEWWDRFYQPVKSEFMKSKLEWPARKLLHPDTLRTIDDRMKDKFGYKLSKSAHLTYDNGITIGYDNHSRQNGYCLDFYFDKI